MAELKPKLFHRASAGPATVPGAVYEPNYSVEAPPSEAPPVVIEAYVVGGNTAGGNVDEAETGKTDGHSITDEESGSESGEERATVTDNKKYCGGRISLTCLILLIIVGVMVIAIPVALIKKNDVFTINNANETETGQCRSPRCFTDDDCSFYGYGDNLDVNNSSSPPDGQQCYHAVLRCSNNKNLMTDFCPCLRDSDCVSGRCEGFAAGFSKCAPLLEDGYYCNEASDCQSNRCDRPEPGQAPVCIPKITAICGTCNEDTDCASGECDYLVGRCMNQIAVGDAGNITDGTNLNATILDEGCSCLTASDCMTGRCDFVTNNPLGGRTCQQKAPSCGGCNENSDCASNDCMETVFRCRNENGLMDDKCNCLTNGDCTSDRCEALSLNPLDGFFCFPRNADCRQCNEDSDCQSGKCNLLNFMCGDESGNILDCWF
mmetsp:Transcript_17477/g.29023  ORF Transcript_17477/g.29023 Transcript_17477/m.29023 type:complete len:433 (+) Transcript_17477:152-1450(+)|eukprot:CAMPEP_0119017130 /NCGR_PEP_ID=MMETSP1176-20130426/15493_1 /TAXON_ID=265551 /ORGANISM="Synedropsis recta cf, Strain CCMP1620" /LENGTH=432 /DNA_ID=CAMNT_0006970755 /DNA_START=145 /DNA_END=1443 /DNA_ORIENTATION=-